MNIRLTSTESVVIQCEDPLRNTYKLSPQVWFSNGIYNILLRVVNESPYPEQKVSRIYHGISHDGIHFKLNSLPIIVPGINMYDKDGIEDPTFLSDGEIIYIFYSGWNGTKKYAKLVLAYGDSLANLQKKEVTLTGMPSETMTKEVSVVKDRNGFWHLFYEYYNPEKSTIGVALSKDIMGPWNLQSDLVTKREGKWDSTYLSPGPVIPFGKNKNLMFYNGADEKVNWSIGWIIFNDEYNEVLERSDTPLIIPQDTGGTNIAFCASAVKKDNIVYLYYSLADKLLKRATFEII